MAQLSTRKAKTPSSCCKSLQDLLSPKLFKALSDPRRLALLIRLAEAREACTVGSVAEGSGIDLSVVSRHLAILREAGIIRCEKRGKEVWCVVQTPTLTKVLRDLADALEACCPEGWRVNVADSCGPEKRPAARPARGRK